jgi:hypothetical protein
LKRQACPLCANCGLRHRSKFVHTYVHSAAIGQHVRIECPIAASEYFLTPRHLRHWTKIRSALCDHRPVGASTPPAPVTASAAQSPFEPIKLASFLGSELVGAKVNLDLVQYSSELERHLRVILVDDGRTGVLADVEAFVEREPNRLGQVDATPTDLLSIDGERSSSGPADAAAGRKASESKPDFS